jgi:hypothetical protein
MASGLCAAFAALPRPILAVASIVRQTLPQHHTVTFTPMQQTCTLENARTQEPGMRLHAEVQRALAHNPYFASRALRIELRENEVSLSGVLGSYFHKQMAQESVLSVSGVRRVHNEIRVVPA